jgi:hypothetical protein
MRFKNFSLISYFFPKCFFPLFQSLPTGGQIQILNLHSIILGMPVTTFSRPFYQGIKTCGFLKSLGWLSCDE